MSAHKISIIYIESIRIKSCKIKSYIFDMHQNITHDNIIHVIQLKPNIWNNILTLTKYPNQNIPKHKMKHHKPYWVACPLEPPSSFGETPSQQWFVNPFRLDPLLHLTITSILMVIVLMQPDCGLMSSYKVLISSSTSIFLRAFCSGGLGGPPAGVESI